MKRFPLFLALIVAPHLAFAQTMSGSMSAPPPASTPSVKPATDLPDADELLAHLFDPYEAAKTFRGRFDISLQGHDPKEPPPYSRLALNTSVRFDANGDKERELLELTIQGVTKGQEQTLVYVDDGRSQNTAFFEQKAWEPSERGQVPDLRDILKPLLQQVAKDISDNPTISLAVDKGVDAGRPVYVLHDENSTFRAVVDVQTSALRSLQLLGETTTVSIRGSRQAFNTPLPDSGFKWTPPTGFRRAEADSIALPSFLNSAQAAPIPKAAPAKPKPSK